MGPYPLAKHSAQGTQTGLYDYLLQEAGLTGPEWFALHTQRPTLLKGIDSLADYTAQRMLFVQSRAAREIAANQIASTQRGARGTSVLGTERTYAQENGSA